MRKVEILSYCSSLHGRLSPASQEQFLRRSETVRLQRYPDELVREATGYSSLLREAVEYAAERQPKLAALPAETALLDAPSPRGHVRRPDTDLLRRLGPVQNYGDDT